MMGRWSQYDDNEYRLPCGMTRTGYDADTQTYTYRDANGFMYEGEEGNRYGKIKRGEYLMRIPKISLDASPFISSPENLNNC